MSFYVRGSDSHNTNEIYYNYICHGFLGPAILTPHSSCSSTEDDECTDPETKALREKERRQANNARERYVNFVIDLCTLLNLISVHDSVQYLPSICCFICTV